MFAPKQGYAKTQWTGSLCKPGKEVAPETFLQVECGLTDPLIWRKQISFLGDLVCLLLWMPVPTHKANGETRLSCVTWTRSSCLRLFITLWVSLSVCPSASSFNSVLWVSVQTLSPWWHHLRFWFPQVAACSFLLQTAFVCFGFSWTEGDSPASVFQALGLYIEPPWRLVSKELFIMMILVGFYQCKSLGGKWPTHWKSGM